MKEYVQIVVFFLIVSILVILYLSRPPVATSEKMQAEYRDEVIYQTIYLINQVDGAKEKLLLESCEAQPNNISELVGRFVRDEMYGRDVFDRLAIGKLDNGEVILIWANGVRVELLICQGQLYIVNYRQAAVEPVAQTPSDVNDLCHWA